MFRLVTTAAFALLLALGPLGFLQAAAWTGMAIDYSTRYGLGEGLERTFDGKNPCSLCTAINETRKDQAADGQAVTVTPVKLVCLPVQAVAAPASPLCDKPETFGLPATSVAWHTDQPDLPPPRTLEA